MEYHEYANLFPMMPDADLKSLADDIKKNGLADDIITFDGKILDGRNRFRACAIAGVKPRLTEYAGEDPLGFVVSHNLHRRHLTESQRAMVAAKWAKLKHGEIGNGRKVDSPIGDSTPPIQSETKTRDEAAKLLNIGTSSIDRAKKVIKEAPELVEKIENGEISVNAAYVTTKTPAEPEPEPVIVDATKETPAPEKRERLPKYIPNDAHDIWAVAQTHLNRILPNDISREEVLREVIEYCKKRISDKK